MPSPGSFPAIQCRLGDWVYFVTALPFAEVEARIRRAEEIHTHKGLNDMIQRALSDRKGDIADYIRGQGERFFNAIVVGIYGGAPDWFSVEIEQMRQLETDEHQIPNLSERGKNAFGILHLSGEENLFAIDGQHRVEGIKEALKEKPSLANEELAVLFVAHKTTTSGMARTRRLFTTLNKYAKPVKLSDIIALDEDDAFAIVTRMIVENYEGLSRTTQEAEDTISLVRFGQALIPPSDKHSITSIETVYKLIHTLSLPRSDVKRRRSFKQLRPTPEVIDSMYGEHVSFWEFLRTYVSPMSEALGSEPTDCMAGRYRTESGGNILFRPVGQTAFAGAVRILLDRKFPLDEAVSALSQTTLALHQPPWAGVLWDPGRRGMLRYKAELSESLFLHMVGQAPRRSKFDIESSYRDAVGDPLASLDSIPKALPIQ